METFVHSPDYKKNLKEFYRVLKPNGKLVLFEYSLNKNLSPKEKKMWDFINREWAMHSLPYFLHGEFPKILMKAGFTDISVSNKTERIYPMLKRFYTLAFWPHKIIKLLKLEKIFSNSVFSVEAYPGIIHNDTWRYNIVTAVKNKHG